MKKKSQGTQCLYVIGAGLWEGIFFFYHCGSLSIRFHIEYVFTVFLRSTYSKYVYFPSWLAEICPTISFAVFIQGYSLDYLNYSHCTFFLTLLNNIHRLC